MWKINTFKYNCRILRNSLNGFNLIDGIDVNDAASGSEYDFGQLFSYNISSIDILSGAFSNVQDYKSRK